MAAERATLNLTSRVKKNDEIFSSVVDKDLILFDPTHGAYFGAGRVGSKIWELLDEERSVRALCDKLCVHFDIEPETCVPETLAFLEQLREQDLILEA